MVFRNGLVPIAYNEWWTKRGMQLPLKADFGVAAKLKRVVVIL
jgi:hypothetical protein